MTEDDAFSLVDDTARVLARARGGSRSAFAHSAPNGMLARSMKSVARAIRVCGLILSATLCLALQACSVIPPDADAGSGPNRTPGEPFLNNLCFQCTLRACNVSLRACAREAMCSRWFDCVALCPTDESGVAAEGECLQKCPVPVSASVLFDCIQEFSLGSLRGCEQACTPLP